MYMSERNLNWNYKKTQETKPPLDISHSIKLNLQCWKWVTFDWVVSQRGTVKSSNNPNYCSGYWCSSKADCKVLLLQAHQHNLLNMEKTGWCLPRFLNEPRPHSFTKLTWVLGIWIQVFMLVWQALYQQRHLLNLPEYILDVWINRIC